MRCAWHSEYRRFVQSGLPRFCAKNGQKKGLDLTDRIIYVDMDAFYASIEQCENPKFRGKPVIVGGNTERSVVSAASYEARKFGVHSAMSMVKAKKLCPQGIIVPVNMKLYIEYSKRVIDILSGYSPRVEQVSIDEACIDMSEWRIPNMDDLALANTIQKEIFDLTGLSASIGIASSKALAKMASDFKKPKGITIIEPGQEKVWLAPLPIKELRGVGYAALEKMQKMRISTIGQFAALTEQQAKHLFGVNGTSMWKLANGIDLSEVNPNRERKSIGREYTFLHDEDCEEVILKELLYLSEDVAYKLVKYNFLARGITVKIRYYDFCTITRSIKFSEPNATTQMIYTEAAKLFSQVAKRPIRLIGVCAAPLIKETNLALALDTDEELRKAKRLELGRQVVVSRFGKKAMSRAKLLDINKPKS